MRNLSLIGVALLAACAPQSQKASPSADATLAKETVERYFDLIRQRKFNDAYRMWGNEGADTRGSAMDFEKSFEPYSDYVAEVGDPTDIKTSTGQEYIAVAAKVRVTLKQTGASSDLSGPIMLRRPAATGAAWQIWGADVRARN